MSALERWVYAGRREAKGGGLVGLWLDPDGIELAFKGPHRSIGSVYEVSVDRVDGAVRAGVKGARWLQADGEDERAARWELEDRAAYTEDTARKAEAALKRDAGANLDGLTVGDLRRLVITAPAARRTALIAVVLQRIGA